MKNYFLTLTLHPSVDRILEVERWRSGGTFEARLRAVVPAGKGVNTARALRGLLGHRVRIQAAAWAGGDECAFFARALARERIAFLPCARACPTRACWTCLERATGRETHVKESMPRPCPSEERTLRAFVSRLPLRHACAAVCGSAPAGTSAATLEACFRSLRARAQLLVADSHGACLQAAGRAGLDGLKGNAEEIGAWLGLERALDPGKAAHRRALAQALKRGGLGMILVTLGAGGALLAAPAGQWQARPPRLKPGAAQSAVGCGDAATAGWLWALSEGCVPPEALRRAVACGTAKLCRADPGGLDGRLARGLLAATRVQELPRA